MRIIDCTHININMETLNYLEKKYKNNLELLEKAIANFKKINIIPLLECYNQKSKNKCKIDTSQEIGSGAFGIIYNAKLTLNTDFDKDIAVKIQWYNKNDESTKQDITNEILITDHLKDLKTKDSSIKYIPEFYGYNWINTKNYIFGLIFMEKLSKTLDDYIIKMIEISNYDAIKLTIEKVLNIILDLNKNNIFHNDIHFGNFMFNSHNRLKIIDYGLTITLNDINKDNMEYKNPTLTIIENFCKDNEKKIDKICNLREKLLDKDVQKYAHSIFNLYYLIPQLKTINPKYPQDKLLEIYKKIKEEKNKYLYIYCSDNKQYYRRTKFNNIIMLFIILMYDRGMPPFYIPEEEINDFLRKASKNFIDFFGDELERAFGENYKTILKIRY